MSSSLSLAFDSSQTQRGESGGQRDVFVALSRQECDTEINMKAELRNKNDCISMEQCSHKGLPHQGLPSKQTKC